MKPNNLEPPKRSAGDALHAVAKAGLSAVPLVGGPAVELFQYVVQPPLEKRKEAWMIAVGEELQRLEATGFKLENLQSNQEFVSAVLHASTIALKTHQSVKLTALKNAVLNIAKGQAPEEAVQHLFFGYVDALTELHLRILKTFQSPPIVPGMSMGGLGNVLEFAVPDLRGNRNLYDQFWKDLYSRGLVNTENLHTTMSESGLQTKRTTEFGDAFLIFIS